ncbi:MAG: hypothetical protein E6K94_10675 [Thaumarchaeota archaeon]|jgi:hypothetical protein|nr:MAG: hypothetical protein E6L03_08750 [Nitrososphaerota archaeon]TLX89249.1 MAG: hypothetical protein E6K94_10675 [Nitrososphaerota archaeon]
MSAHDDKIYSGSGYMHMKGVALSILLMGLSLVGIIIAYLLYGYIGPSFSAERINVQQAELRHEYGLPPREVIRNQTILLTPPSMRNLSQNSING